MTYNGEYFYDLESFPTFSCISFINKKTQAVEQFSFGCGYNDLKILNEFVSNNILLIGFNNHSYDDAALRFILSQNNIRSLTRNLFSLSARLISQAHRTDEDLKKLRYPKKGTYLWDSIDLMKIMAFDRVGVSLKQIAVNLKHDKIQDLPYAYDYEISHQSEVDTVREYNKNDVHITEKLYYAILPQIQLREDIGKIYNVDVRSASDSKMGNIILEHFYITELNADIKKIRDLRTKRESVNLCECVPEIISFKSRELQQLREKVCATTVYAPNFKFKEVINFRGLGYTIASGGIHSTEKSIVYRASPDEKIITCDIASMYPTCIIINNIYPEHLGEGFVTVLKMLTTERISAKKKDKVKADGLKITTNGLYGKLNSDTFWLEDAKAMLRVTIAGQLYILMLVEMLSDIGIQCISANTDGIECKVTLEKEKDYYKVCTEWEKKTGFTLEYDEYSIYAKRDVNNYVAVYTNGKTKAKGALISEIDLKKGYKHPIVARAVYEHFVNGTPIENTIRSCNDVLDFCISQKSAPKFQMEYHTLDGASKKITKLQKTNRFYVSNTGGTFYKRNLEDNGLTGLFVGQNIRLLNEYNSSNPLKNHDINFDWYIKEAKDAVEDIEPSTFQLDLFSFTNMDFGSLEKMTPPQAALDNKKTKKITIKEKDVREAYKTRSKFPSASSKYFMVTNIFRGEHGTSIKVYSMAKGTEHSFKIKKNVENTSPLNTGEILLAEEFIKKDRYKKEGEGFVKVIGEYVWQLDAYKKISSMEFIKELYG